VPRALPASVLGLVLAVAVAGCTPPSSGASPSGQASAGGQPVLSLTDVDVEPLEIREETVAIAFDADAAAHLVAEVPAEVDFDEHALACVFLGPRLTSGWSLDLRTASLSGGELRIRARETAPRTETEAQETYPADCALLTRAALPVGELRVWADDTVTDEFIAEAMIEVPPPSSVE
jgi:hypothetical protein